MSGSVSDLSSNLKKLDGKARHLAGFLLFRLSTLLEEF